MQVEPAKAVAVAKKEFPTLDPAMVEAAVKRIVADKVYPDRVDITPAALRIALDTQIALGNPAAQPDYATFVQREFIANAIAAHRAASLPIHADQVWPTMPGDRPPEGVQCLDPGAGRSRPRPAGGIPARPANVGTR